MPHDRPQTLCLSDRMTEKHQANNFRVATTKLIPTERIQVRKRIREDLGDLQTLQNSIREHGLLNPVLVDNEYHLIAGERRLRAVQALGQPRIEARIIDNPDRVGSLDMEVHENLLRKDFTEQEIAKSIEEKKRLLQPAWYRRIMNWLLRLKRRLFARRTTPAGTMQPPL